MRWNRVTICYAIWLIGACNGCCGKEKTQPLTPVLEGLESKEHTTRVAASKKVVDDRTRLVAALVEFAKQATPKETGLQGKKELAIRLLGDLRAEEAIDVLLDEVLFEVEGVRTSDDPLSGFLCANALIGIGNPAVWRGISNRLYRPTSQKELRVLACIVYSLDGEDLAIYRLKRELENSGFPELSRNVQAMLDFCERRAFDP